MQAVLDQNYFKAFAGQGTQSSAITYKEREEPNLELKTIDSFNFFASAQSKKKDGSIFDILTTEIFGIKNKEKNAQISFFPAFFGSAVSAIPINQSHSYKLGESIKIRFINEEVITPFINTHPEIKEYLKEVVPLVKEFFKDARISLRLVTYSDAAEKEECLFLYIYTEIDVKDAMSKLATVEEMVSQRMRVDNSIFNINLRFE